MSSEEAVVLGSGVLTYTVDIEWEGVVLGSMSGGGVKEVLGTADVIEDVEAAVVDAVVDVELLPSSETTK